MKLICVFLLSKDSLMTHVTKLYDWLKGQELYFPLTDFTTETNTLKLNKLLKNKPK